MHPHDQLAAPSGRSDFGMSNVQSDPRGARWFCAWTHPAGEFRAELDLMGKGFTATPRSDVTQEKSYPPPTLEWAMGEAIDQRSDETARPSSVAHMQRLQL
jgi:hypothetical protein